MDSNKYHLFRYETLPTIGTFIMAQVSRVLLSSYSDNDSDDEDEDDHADDDDNDDDGDVVKDVDHCDEHDNDEYDDICDVTTKTNPFHCSLRLVSMILKGKALLKVCVVSLRKKER